MNHKVCARVMTVRAEPVGLRAGLPWVACATKSRGGLDLRSKGGCHSFRIEENGDRAVATVHVLGAKDALRKHIYMSLEFEPYETWSDTPTYLALLCCEMFPEGGVLHQQILKKSKRPPLQTLPEQTSRSRRRRATSSVNSRPAKSSSAARPWLRPP